MVGCLVVAAAATSVAMAGMKVVAVKKVVAGTTVAVMIATATVVIAP